MAAIVDVYKFWPDLWTAIHDEAQGQFALHEAEVRRKAADISVKVGRTKGERFYLFTYRKFSVSANEFDSVVVGLTFKPIAGDVTVEADVSGEGTGDSILSAPSRTVAKSRAELVAATRELARSLFQGADAIVAALKDPSRKLE